jgi:hypothetical protein
MPRRAHPRAGEEPAAWCTSRLRAGRFQMPPTSRNAATSSRSTAKLAERAVPVAMPVGAAGDEAGRGCAGVPQRAAASAPRVARPVALDAVEAPGSIRRGSSRRGSRAAGAPRRRRRRRVDELDGLRGRDQASRYEGGSVVADVAVEGVATVRRSRAAPWPGPGADGRCCRAAARRREHVLVRRRAAEAGQALDHVPHPLLAAAGGPLAEARRGGVVKGRRSSRACGASAPRSAWTARARGSRGRCPRPPPAPRPPRRWCRGRRAR